jgi:hypothetical protein
MTLDDLLRLAAEATPGPWRDVPHDWPERAIPVVDDTGRFVTHASAHDFAQRKADAAHIAAFSPEVAAALVKVAVAAGESAERIDSYCSSCEGRGWYETADPNRFGEPGDPRREPCLDSIHVEPTRIRASLAALDAVLAARP